MGEGDRDVGDDGGEVVGEDGGDDDGPGSAPAPPEARGEGPPSSSSSLTSSLDGRRFSPLVLVLHGVGGARAPPRLDLSLCLSLFPCSLMFLGFMDIYRRKKSVRGAVRGPRGWGRALRGGCLVTTSGTGSR